ncbi:NAD-dependent epimerase [Saccharomonospora piscinae]|uniref:NAD-dependent epimerase n=1 Tax=Saccharomonospora piscinae TaxID=687388 RepID=A0A1V9A511_SACPI|nr:SgcJ/EcaC family oxidoreductase [Saccharomonospora piscinae]OQO92161.1 NAD-dependent epimerase [Saccharomonospora piscinae]TLW92155.1 SgcJ/EcaC family oxidoreductase [Saccharomonospora piscinae]
MPRIAGVPVPQEDVDAIVDLVAGVQHAQQNALPDAFLAAFRPDTIWTTAHGRQLSGLDEIGPFTRAVLPGTIDHDVTATYEAESILFLRPDVAAVKIRQRPVTRDGKPLADVFLDHDDPAALVAEHPDAVPGTPLYVLVKDEGAWRIGAAQNTKVLDPETLAAG